MKDDDIQEATDINELIRELAATMGKLSPLQRAEIVVRQYLSVNNPSDNVKELFESI